MPQVFLDWENISKNNLEQAFFFILSSFFLIWDLVSKNLLGITKNLEYYADFKNVNNLNDKMLQKKLKVKNKNIWESGKFRPFKLPFWEHFVSKANQNF